MLKIDIDEEELYDEETSTFLTIDSVSFELEHSLLSLSKWEAKYQKPFLSDVQKTPEETTEYILCMITTPGITHEHLKYANKQVFETIHDYINSAQSATTFGDLPKSQSAKETITSELIYYWMVAFNIPFECETWHLNRLLSLVRICNIKNSKPKKMSRHEMAQRNRELNAKRRAELGTSG